jgi:hypothetical protein
MTSIGSAAPGAQGRSGYAVLTFLLALLLGAVTPLSLWSQVTVTTLLPSPQCAGTAFNVQAAVTNHQSPNHTAPALGAWAAMLAQNAGGVGNGAVNNLALGDDDLSGAQFPQQVGGADFEFNFYGEILNLTNGGFEVSSNGFITFNVGANNAGIIPANVPNNALPNKTVLIANVDLDPGAGGDVWWQVQEDANGNYLVVTFDAVPFVNPFGANVASFQLIIYEDGYAGTPSRMEWRLDDVPQPGGFFAVMAGFENGCGTAGQAAYQNAALNYVAVVQELYTSDPVLLGPPYANISVQFRDNAVNFGAPQVVVAPGVAVSNVALAVPPANRGVGNHNYSAVVTYTYNNCTTEQITSAAAPFTVVANPAPQAINNPTAPRCGASAGTASVSSPVVGNTYTWAPNAAITSFTPNGTNAASTTTIVYNNAALSPAGTSVTLQVTEALSVAPFCLALNVGTPYTVYQTPGTPTITGSGSNNGGINPPALVGAVGNPCAGDTRTYTSTASGTLGGSTFYRWQLSGAAAGTTIGGFAVVAGAADIVTNTNTVNITWGSSTTNVVATLVSIASNGTGGVAGNPGSQASCPGPASAATSIYINGVPAVQQIQQTIPPLAGASSTVCENQTRTYGVTLNAGSSYVWSVTFNPSGVVPGANYNLVTGAAPNNNSATIDWNVQGSYLVRCVETSSGGCVTTHTPHAVTVNHQPQPVFSVAPILGCTYIGGPIQNGQNLTEYAYTITPDNTANQFDWAVSNGIFASNGLSALVDPAGLPFTATQNVRWTSPGANQVLVTETIVATGCSKTISINVTVSASPTPKTLTGPGYVTGLGGNPCASTGPHLYTIGGPWPNANLWVVSVTGGALSVPLNLATGEFGVTWGAVTSGVIRVVETLPAAPSCATEREFSITVNPQPTGNITPNPTAVCHGGTALLRFDPTGGTVLPGATYAWTTTTGANISFVGATNAPTATVQGTNLGAAVFPGDAICTVTNPGVGGCAVAFASVVNVVPNPVVAAPTVPAPICVGGTYNITGNASAYPGGGVTRKWSFTLTPVVAYTGSAVLTANFNLNAAAANWNITIGDSSLADVLTAGTFNLTVTVKDSLAPASCVGTNNSGPYNVLSRPTRPQLDLPVPQTVCNGSYPQDYTIQNFNGAYIYTIGPATTAGGASTVVPGVPTVRVTAWGGTGQKVLELLADDGNCIRSQRWTMDVVSAPANPQPAPVTIANVCVDSGYFDYAGGFPAVLSPNPTRIVTYSAPSPLANHWYQWYVTNGFIVSGSGPYTAVGTNTVAALNATSCQVVWTGPSPGKVKYLVFTSNPGTPPPAPCFATSVEPTVLLPIVPTAPLSFTTTSSEPGDKVCEGQTIDLILSGSKVGLTHRVEKLVAGVWTSAGAVQVAGTGAAINLTIPISALTITTSPITDDTFRITAKDLAFVPGSCEWLRTSTNNIVVHVYETPNDIPVVVVPANLPVCEGDVVDLEIGTVGQPSQTHVMYEIWRRQIFPVVGAYVYTGVSGLGNGGLLPLAHNTGAADGTGGPLLSVDNYQYEVRAYIPVAPLLAPASGCPFTMTAHPTNRVFEYPQDPTVTFFPNPICWEELITVNLASTEAGVEYEVRANGSFLSPQVILQGTGGAVSTQFNVALIQPTNPVSSAVVPNVEVVARLVQNGTYTRPIPTSACLIPYGTVNYTVREKPVAIVSGPTNSCGPSTANYTASPVTPAPPETFAWLITTVPPVGTTPTFANPTVSGTVDPFTVNWGTHLLSCNGVYNPLAQTIRMIATNFWGCTDTAFYNVTIEPTVADAVISGPSTACIYGGFEQHLTTYTVARPNPCVFPANTTFLWTMPTGVVSGAIRSGQSTPTIVAEWYTTGGTNIGTVQCDITLPPSHGGCTTTKTFNVVVNPLPVPAINGPAIVCQGDLGKVYIADNYPTDTYNWQVIGGTIVGGTGNGVVGDTAVRSGVGLNSITINWLDTPNPNAFIRLREVSVVGCMNVTTFFVNVNPTPVPVINGADKACDNSVYSYSTANNAPANTYAWSVVTGNATITGGANQATATVLTGPIGSGSSFTLTLTETVLATNCTKTVNKVVTVVEKPNPTITRLAPAGGAVGGACLGQTVTYGNSDPVAANPTYSYKWTVLNGAISGADNGATLMVTWNTVGTGTITLNKWHTGSQCTTTVVQNVTIVNAPAPTISGPNSVCGLSSQVYSTPNVAGNTYSWSISSNGSITGGATTNAATFLFNNPTPGSTLPTTISVTETNTLSGCATTVNNNVTINYQPQVATITRVSPAGAANQACNNSTIVYSVPNNTGSTYLWTVTGGTIISGGTTNQVTVQWVNVGTQTLTVVEKDASGTCSATSVLNVGVTYQPVPAISGDANPCTEDIRAYTTPAVAGSTYVWSLPSLGGNILSGTTSNSMTVQWTLSGTRSVQVVETNGNCTATATLTVNVGKTPTSTAIARISPAGVVDKACETDVITYSTPLNGTSSYKWTVTGGSIVGSSTSNTVVINWTQQGVQTLTVVETTIGSTCSTTVSQTVTVTYKPTPNINGANVACINKDHVYSTPYVAGSSYVWSITPTNAFAQISGYPNSNVIQVKWIQSGLHTVSVTETNIAGGCSTTATMQVQVNEKPTPFINSVTGYGNPNGRRPGIVCNFSTHTYTTFATPGNTFSWKVVGGSIISGQYTNTVSVTWGPSGTGTLEVEETIPGSDCITTDRDTFDIRPTPSPNITGNFNPCGASSQVYTTPFVTGNSYNWVVVGGTITSGQGTNSITVAWQNPAWPNIINGSVTVTEWVTDVLPSQSCINTNTRTITIRPNPPVPTITGLNVVCATDLTDNPITDNQITYSTSIPAQGSNQGFITYAWSVSSNGTIVGSTSSTSAVVRWTNTTSVPTTGTITILQTSSFGCTVSGSLNVTINPLPNPVISGVTSVCLNSLNVYSTPGVPGNTYSWTVTGGNPIRAGQGTPNVTIEWTVLGTHTVTVTETNVYGCVVLNSLTVTVNNLPSVTITASGPTTFCQGGDVTLSAPIGFVSYVWSTGETSRSIIVHTGGSYSVKVTDANGCTNTSNTIVVNVFPSSLPIITVSGPTTFCEGGSVTLTAPSGFTAYRWSTGAITQSITVTRSGTYTVTVADGNGCTGTSTEVDVFVNPKPVPVLTVVGSTTVCSGDSVEVRAPQGYVSYTWRSSSNTNYGTGRSIQVKRTDTIYCEVVDVNGCVGRSDTVIITVSPTPAPIVTPGGPTTFCDGGSVLLSGPTGFDSYLWSNGATTREITVTEGADYILTATNRAGCESVSAPTKVTVSSNPARPTITRNGDVLTANTLAPAKAYQWYRTGLMLPGATEKTLSVSVAGTYRVEIADNNTCSSISDGFDVILTDVDEPTVVAGFSELRVFPNPTAGAFSVESDVIEAGNVRIELVNNLGETVFTIDRLADGGAFSANVEMGTLANGVYNVVVTTAGQRWTVRLVRQ